MAYTPPSAELPPPAVIADAPMLLDELALSDVTAGIAARTRRCRDNHEHDQHDAGLRPGHPAEAAGGVAGRPVLGDDERSRARCSARRSSWPRSRPRKRSTQAGKAAGMLGGAGLAGWMALIMLSFALAWLLDQGLNTALSFAIVGIVWIIVAAVLFAKGKRQLKTVETLPQTKETHQGGRPMGQSADELRRDIEDTRYGLTDTLDAIGDRVSPGRVIERRKNRAVQGLQSVRERVMGSVGGARDSVTDTTGSAMGTAVDTVKGTPDTVRQQTQGSPLAAGAIAFGVGFLVAAAFPASQPEQEAAQGLMDKAEPLKEELTSVGKDVAEQVKGVAQEAVEEVKSTAADSKQAVADTVKGGVESTKATTQDAAGSA